MSNIPQVIISKDGIEKPISKVAWENMGKFTSGWVFVRNADPNDSQLPANVKSSVSQEHFIPEEIKAMGSIPKKPEMKLGKITLKEFTDAEIMAEYVHRNQTGNDNSPIVERETKLVRMEMENTTNQNFLNAFADKKKTLAADIEAIEKTVKPMFDDEYLTKDARTRLTTVMDMVAGLKSNQF